MIRLHLSSGSVVKMSTGVDPEHRIAIEMQRHPKDVSHARSEKRKAAQATRLIVL